MAVKLKNLKKGEYVDIVIRRHWIAFVLVGVYFLLAILFTGIVLGIFGLSIFSQLLLVLFWIPYSLFLYVSWINYELDLFIFTNNRVVCVEQKSFLNRAVGETTLDKVQEVDLETKGLLANLFDYGTLRITTAGSTQSFDMSFCPKPMVHSRYINNLVDQYRDNMYSGNNAASDKNSFDPKNQVNNILASSSGTKV